MSLNCSSSIVAHMRASPQSRVNITLALHTRALYLFALVVYVCLDVLVCVQNSFKTVSLDSVLICIRLVLLSLCSWIACGIAVALTNCSSFAVTEWKI